MQLLVVLCLLCTRVITVTLELPCGGLEGSQSFLNDSVVCLMSLCGVSWRSSQSDFM